MERFSTAKRFVKLCLIFEVCEVAIDSQRLSFELKSIIVFVQVLFVS